MTKPEILARFEELKTEAQAALDASRGDGRSPGAMRAAVDTSRAVSYFMAQHPFLAPKLSKSLRSNQAGQRQFNERHHKCGM